jgi:pyrroloquinoline quinone biosynthesis protein B
VRRLALVLLAAAPACASPDPAPQPSYRARLLGAAQDAGLPHLGCEAEVCAEAFARGERRRVSALALEGPDGWWLLDATPDLTEQVAAMGSLPQGILLTHAHIGHYTGLMYLGREGLGARGMPVLAAPRMAAFLSAEQPWAQLVELGQVELVALEPDRPAALDDRLSVVPLLVPHRDELSETVGFLIALDGRARGLYLPDIDRWERWDRDLVALARELDWMVLDGTFWSAAELPGRDLDEIPHPPVTVTLDRLQEVRDAGGARVVFSHLNHSNPLWRDGPERAELRARGFEHAVGPRPGQGPVLPLGG